MNNEDLKREPMEQRNQSPIDPERNQPRREGTAQPNQDAERMHRQVESDLAQIRSRVQAGEQDIENETKSRRKSVRSTKIALVLLLVGVAGAGWYFRSALLNHSGQLSQLPSISDSIGKLGQRTDAAEEKLRAWSSEYASLGARLTGVEKKALANFQLARHEAQQMVAQASQRLEDEVSQRLEPLQTRLGRIESAQETEQARLEQLDNQLSALSRQTSQELARMKQENARDISDVNQRVAWTKQDIEELSKRMSFNRVDFEIARNHSGEIAPGIKLHVSKTNVDYQRSDGWLQLVPDAKTVWVRGQGILQPVVFFTQKDNRPHALIFTRVAKDGTVGYLLIPTPTDKTYLTSQTGEGAATDSAVAGVR